MSTSNESTETIVPDRHYDRNVKDDFMVLLNKNQSVHKKLLLKLQNEKIDNNLRDKMTNASAEFDTAVQALLKTTTDKSFSQPAAMAMAAINSIFIEIDSEASIQLSAAAEHA